MYVVTSVGPAFQCLQYESREGLVNFIMCNGTGPLYESGWHVISPCALERVSTWQRLLCTGTILQDSR